MIDDASEVRLLASLIDNPELIIRISEKLFTSERIGIFRAMKEAYISYGELSTEGVENFLKRPLNIGLEAARGAKPEPIIDKLKVLAKKRQLVDISNSLTILMAQADPSMENIQQTLSFEAILAEDDSKLQPGVVEFLSDVKRKRTGQYEFVRTGLPILDYLMGGEWGRKTLTVVIGSGGAGKTALVVNSMLRMAMQGQPVLFVSLEMSKDKIISRMVSSITEIDNRMILSGQINDDQMAAIDEALAQLQSLPIYIIDRARMTVSQIINQVRIHKELYGIEAFFVDYLQIINDETDDEVASLGRIAQSIRDAAVTYDIAAVLLAQQNRTHEGTASIFGSGRVGFIADSVFELKTAKEDKDNDDARMIMLDFHKNRNGPLGSQGIVYRPKFLRFDN